MAQLDHNIYFQQRTPDIMGGVEQGMKLSQLAQQRKLANRQMEEQDAERSVYEADPVTGKVGVSAGKLSELGKANPFLAHKIQGKVDADSAAKKKAQFESYKEKITLGSQLVGALDPGNLPRYQAQRQELIGMGIYGQNEIPEVPDVKWIDGEKKKGLSALEQINQHFKQEEHGLKREEMGLRREEHKAKIQELKIKTKGDSAKMATELRKERSGLPTTKATQEVSAAYNKIQSAAKNPSPAGDMALIFNYMKMLDPGSTVREGEYATAQQATNVPNQVLNAYNRVISGQKLNPDQRKDFLGRSGGMYKAQMDVQKKVDSSFAQLAQDAGVDPSKVLVNFEANKVVDANDLDSLPDEDLDRLVKELGGQ